MSTTVEPAALDEARLQEFVGKFAADLAATMHAATVAVGHKLGLYQALAAGPASGAGLAERTGLDRRLVEEWCNAQFASGYSDYDSATGRFSLNPEQAACLADSSGPAFLAAAMVLAGVAFKDEAAVREAFHTGRGLPWHAHDPDLFVGTEQFFRPGYVANLTTSWIPSLDGVEAKLKAGAKVADVGCGHGVTSILLAQTYPRSTVVGFDYHAGSIDAARAGADGAGVGDRVRFEVTRADDFGGDGYDLVCIFDALHDMSDPGGVARHIRQAVAEDGTWLLVEPMAGEALEDNASITGRIFYSAAPFICAAHAESEGGPLVLGNQVPDSRWQELVGAEGFTRFRRAAETPFNRIFEIRP